MEGAGIGTDMQDLVEGRTRNFVFFTAWKVTMD